MIVFGIASAISHDVAELYATESEAADMLNQVLADAPELEGLLWVERLELGEESVN